MKIPSGGVMRIVVIAGIVVITAIGLLFSTSLIEQVDADEIVILQGVVSGDLSCHVMAGPIWQGFGKTTSYPKRNIYEFEKDITFNDGGDGTIMGSVQWEMPLDCQNLVELHTRFNNHDAIQQQLVAQVTDKSVTMTGPLLSSTESYAERRTDMIYWVEDQIVNGTYRTRQIDVVETDPMTGEQRNIIQVDIQLGEDGQPLRQERGQLTVFGISPFNFTVQDIDYGDQVEAQIREQQGNIMRVQTSIAEARMAEQQAITIEQQGLADAARARAEQEVERAREVTRAEQALEVAKLQREAADEYRQQQILIGQGDAERKRLVMQADGALEQKLAAYVEIQKAYAAAISDHAGPWVPSVVMGGTGEGQNSALNLIEMLQVQAARDLALDLRPRTGN